MEVFNLAAVSEPGHSFSGVSEAEQYLATVVDKVDFTHSAEEVDEFRGSLALVSRLSPNKDFVGRVLDLELSEIEDPFNAFCSVSERGGIFEEKYQAILSNGLQLNKRFMFGFRIDFDLKVTGRASVDGLTREMYFHPPTLNRTNRKYFLKEVSGPLMRVSVARQSGVLPDKHFKQAYQRQTSDQRNNSSRSISRSKPTVGKALRES